MREDKVTDEQVFSEKVDELTSRRVNELIARKDKVTGEQVFSEKVDELTSRQVNELLAREDKVTDEQMFTRQLKKPCFYVTLSFTYPVYPQLLNLSTCTLVNFKDLVPMLLCLLFTLSTSNSFTRLLVHSSTRPSCQLFSSP